MVTQWHVSNRFLVERLGAKTWHNPLFIHGHIQAFFRFEGLEHKMAKDGGSGRGGEGLLPPLQQFAPRA